MSQPQGKAWSSRPSVTPHDGNGTVSTNKFNSQLNYSVSNSNSIQNEALSCCPQEQRPAQPQAWLERLIRDEGASILSALWRVLGNEEDVLEAYQECWCAMAALSRPSELRCAKAFAYRTAVNLAIEMIRRRARRRGLWPAVVAQYGGEKESVGVDEFLASQHGESSLFLREESRRELLRRSLEKLAGHLQRVVVLRDFAGMSYRAIAEILGIDPGTARVYRRQAIVRLAELMGSH